MLGILGAAFSTGQLIFLPAMAHVIDMNGWRAASLIVAGLAVLSLSACAATPTVYRAALGPQAAVEPAQAVLIQTVEGLAAEPVTAEELKRAKRQWAKQFDELMANPQALCVTLSDAIGAGDWRFPATA